MPIFYSIDPDEPGAVRRTEFVTGGECGDSAAVDVPAGTADAAAVFLWDSLSGLRPLCGAQSVALH